MSHDFMAVKAAQEVRRHAQSVRVLRSLLFAEIGPLLWKAPRLELDEPTIVLCNHARYSDSIFMQIASRGRLAVCGAKLHYFSSWKKNYFLALLDVIPVDGRDQFVIDCCQLLRQGKSILIYPEMGRNPKAMGEFKDWFAEVVERSGVAVQVACLNKVYERASVFPSLNLGQRYPPGSLMTRNREDLLAGIRCEIETLMDGR